MGGTPLHAKVITGLLGLVLLCLIRSPRRFVHFYFLMRPLIQPFAYNQYRLIGGVPLTGIFPVIVIGYTCILTVFSRQRTFLVKNSIFLYMMLLFFLLSSVFSTNYISTISWSLKFLTGVMVFILVYNNITDEDDFLVSMKSFVYCAIVPMAFGYYQFLTKTGHAWKGDFYKGSRIDSCLGEYNAYGEFLCLIICATIIWIAKEKDKRKRLFVILALLSLGLSLLLSLNRGSWVALVAGLGVASIVFYKHLKVKWLVIAFLVVSIAGAPIIIQRFQELDLRTDYGSKNTLEGRVNYWQNISGLIIDRPFLGYGAGASMIVLEKRFGASALPPHNDYLLLWLECGVFTVIAYILFLASNAIFFLTRRNHLGIINYSLSAVCMYFMIISFFQNIINNVTVFPLFLAMVGAGLKLNILAATSANASSTLPVQPVAEGCK